MEWEPRRQTSVEALNTSSRADNKHTIYLHLIYARGSDGSDVFTPDSGLVVRNGPAKFGPKPIRVPRSENITYISNKLGLTLYSANNEHVRTSTQSDGNNSVPASVPVLWRGVLCPPASGLIISLWENFGPRLAKCRREKSPRTIDQQIINDNANVAVICDVDGW
ncbi:hypothetical protein J6590_011589 [Homalodisca vitripennis]|nr:hypothetical protein J6590_011589 [Homalodisca vitripennis]